MMLVQTKSIFVGAIDNWVRAQQGKLDIAVTCYPSAVTFDMIGLWFLTIETDFDAIVARNNASHELDK